MSVASKYQDHLGDIKKDVQSSYDYMFEDYKRFKDYRRMVFDTTITQDDQAVLGALDRPVIECNILETILNRQWGEFESQQPAIEVGADEGCIVDDGTIEAVDGHFRHALDEANQNGFTYKVYKDSTSGGFGVMRLYTKYAHPMSFQQVIAFESVFSPILCGWDPCARAPHKGDGNYCFEFYPLTVSDFKMQFPNVDISLVKYQRAFSGFNWSFVNGEQKVVVVLDYYKKKMVKKKIVQVARFPGARYKEVMTVDEYAKFVDDWIQSGRIEQPPAIVGKPRMTAVPVICRYRCIETEVLEYVETDLPILPLIFVDGNSMHLFGEDGANERFMTRPLVYHARDVQRLMNLGMQSLANELENTIQHKFIISQEALPDNDKWLNAYTNAQKAMVMVHKAYKDNDPSKPLAPPQVVARTPIPPEIMQTIGISTTMLQNVMGIYDAQLGIQENNLSGAAIDRGAMQSNSTLKPYQIGFMQALTQLANGYVAMLPKYYKTPRTIPILKKDGEKDFIRINEQGGPSFNYDENALSVSIKAGVSYALQKSKALDQMIAMSKVNQQLAQVFAESPKALKIFLSNFDIRGIDLLNSAVDEWLEKKNQNAQQQQQMMQQQAMMNPAMQKVMNERMRMQQDAQQDEMENRLKAAEIENDADANAIERAKVYAGISNAKTEAAMKMETASAEKARTVADLAIAALDMGHQHQHQTTELLHRMEMERQEAADRKQKLLNESTQAAAQSAEVNE